MSKSESPLVTAEKPRGFIDRLGDAAAAEERVVGAVGAVYEKWGFERLETPAVEYTEGLGKFLPDLDRPNEGVFSFLDDERWLSLRYDLTAPLARFAAEERQKLPKPFRRWQAGPVWRNEKPGPGRYRQFTQCDADTVGSDNPAADAEMVAMAAEALEAVGVPRAGYVFKINSRRILNGVLLGIGLGENDTRARLTVMRAIDKLDRVGVDGVAALLGKGRKDESGDFTAGAELDAAGVKRVIDFVTLLTDSRAAVLAGLEKLVGDNEEGRAGLKELAGINDVLSALGVDDARARIDPSVVRGLEYYTGAVYEAELTMTIVEDGRPVRFGSVGGGGRYDDLIARFTGERVPATGFSIGVSRLVAAQARLGLGEQFAAQPPVVVLALDEERMGDYFAIASELRAAGVRAEVYLGGAGMKAQLKYADKRDAPVAVIQGGDELAKGVVTLKDLKLGAQLSKNLGEDREAYAKMREQAQREVPRAEVVAAVQQMLAQ
jgi:histidyl-tRNA synthetase